ncbi:hypothetical protein GQ53DRAFT_139285 [Thozetella sp. PMI_491]|nr:hypothetical protein GQ53DRAFT_139285 [Thozetella sp. PMI_491]
MEPFSEGPVHDDGLVAMDPTKLSVAHVPYEIQVMIFEAASDLQILFVAIDDKSISLASDPIQYGLAATCRMARRVFLRGKVRALDRYWVDPARDIFYLRDDLMPIRFRYRYLQEALQKYNRDMMLNVAIDLECLGEHPRRDALIRMWTIFPKMKTLHVFAARDPYEDKPKWNPEDIVLDELPGLRVLSPPGQDRELWWAVKYQLNKTCIRILDAEAGWDGRVPPQVQGHLVHNRSPSGA